MTTIIKALFGPSSNDGLTPMDRLPIVLSMTPDFDGLYMSLLRLVQHFPHCLNIISTIALALEPLSIAQIAELLNIKPFNITNVLINLHAIMQVPGDDHSPVTLWHTSLRDFLTLEERAGPFFAAPSHHHCLAHRAIKIAALSQPSQGQVYSQSFAIQHLAEFVKTIDETVDPFGGEGSTIMPLLERPIFNSRYISIHHKS
jgi:hypothetical protein